MEGTAKIFLEKDGEKTEVDVEKLVGKGGPKFLFKGKKLGPPPQQPEGEGGEESTTEGVDDQSVTEDDPGISEDDPEERETGQKMWLMDKVTSLEEENGELKKELHEVWTRLSIQENTAMQALERCAVLEAAIKRIEGNAQHQNAFNEAVRASFTSMAEEVNRHQNNFTEVVQVIKAHEEYMVRTGAATQDMAQCINALVQENANQTVWISSLVRETQEQTQVLQRHEVGLHVQAHMIKTVVNQQQQQRETATARTVPTVEELDNDNEPGQNFPNGPSPHAGPPDRLVFYTIEPPQVPTNMEITPSF